MNENMETRMYVGKVESRASEDGSKITIIGQPVVFNQKTDIAGLWSESIAPGAIDQSVISGSDRWT